MFERLLWQRNGGEANDVVRITTGMLKSVVRFVYLMVSGKNDVVIITTPK